MVQKGKLTGFHVGVIFFLPFMVIIAVNIVLAVNAVRTFPGLDVKNAYVESQEFNARKEAQIALGWQAEVEYQNGEILLTLQDKEGRPVSPNAIDITVGRATTNKFDADLSMRFNGKGFVAEHELASGKWIVFLNLTAQDGTEFRQIQEIYVK